MVRVAFGQDGDKYPVMLKLNIPSLVDETTFPALRLSVERKTGVKTSIAIEAGYQLYAIEGATDTVYTKPMGIKLGVELRYYPRHQNTADITGFYLAANPFYRYNKYTEGLYYYPEEDKTTYTWDEMAGDNFVVKKTITGIHLMVGRQANLKVPMPRQKAAKTVPRIFFDGSLGIGAFYRHIVNEQREFDETISKRYTSRHPNVYDAMIKSGLSESTGFSPGFTFNFRVGYRL